MRGWAISDSPGHNITTLLSLVNITVFFTINYIHHLYFVFLLILALFSITSIAELPFSPYPLRPSWSKATNLTLLLFTMRGDVVAPSVPLNSLITLFLLPTVCSSRSHEGQTRWESRLTQQQPVNRDEVDRLRKRFMKLDKVGYTAYGIYTCSHILIIYRMPPVLSTATSSSPSPKCRPTRSPQGPLLSPHTNLSTPTISFPPEQQYTKPLLTLP